MTEEPQGPSLTRERLLRAGVGATVSLAALNTPLLRSAHAAPAPHVRRDVAGLPNNHALIAGYKTAYDAMVALPTSDVHSWAYQAAIHGTNLPGNNIAWHTCQHGTPFFWSWHRMYLYYFERIVRKYSGNPNWMLPYWNYAPASQRKLPPPFRASGPLMIANRGAGWNSGAASLPDWAVDASAGMGLTSYFSAQGQLEGTPHGVIHGLIGGWMGSVPTAAQDPIFWLHHANLDRLWNLWLAQGGGRSNPLADAAWKTTQWTFFDENRTQVKLTGCDVLRAAQQLGYRYEDEPTQIKQYCIRFVIPWRFLYELLYRFPISGFVIPPRSDPPPLPFSIAQIRERVERATKSQNETIFLRLDGIRAERPPGVVWQVFVSPRGAKPDPKSPFFVGSLPLFSIGVPTHHGRMATSIQFPVDRALAQSLQSDELQVRFVPAGPLIRGRVAPAKPRTQVRIAQVSLVVETRRKG
jgi:Common central domain of tyrosinase/Polyphenol oxidase middle domain